MAGFLLLVLGNSLPVFSQNIAINTTGATNSTLSMLEILQISATANSKGLYVTNSGGGATNYAAIFYQGNVGIGTLTPGQKLEIANNVASTDYLLKLKNDDGNPAILSGAGITFERDRPWAQIVGKQQNVGDYSAGNLIFITRTSDAANDVTEKMRINNIGAFSLGTSGSNFGTSGQVLTSAGSGASVYWSNPAGGGGGGCFTNATVITTDGQTWTSPASATTVKVEIYGAGGGGGGGGGSSTDHGGGGGGGGGYAVVIFSAPASTVYTAVIGAGGAATGVSSNGNAGSKTSTFIGTNCNVQATAGGGGTAGGVLTTGSPGLGGAGGAGSGGFYNSTLGNGGCGGGGAASGGAVGVAGISGANGGGAGGSSGAGSGAGGGGGGGGVGGANGMNTGQATTPNAFTNSGGGGGGGRAGGWGSNGAAGKVIIYW